MLDEDIFAAYARALDRPWAPDPWLCAAQRVAFAKVMAESKAAECFARIAVLEGLKADLLECVDELDTWAERARWYAIAAEKLKKFSPMPELIEAMRGERPPDRPARWRLGPDGVWRDRLQGEEQPT